MTNRQLTHRRKKTLDDTFSFPTSKSEAHKEETSLEENSEAEENPIEEDLPDSLEEDLQKEESLPEFDLDLEKELEDLIASEPIFETPSVDQSKVKEEQQATEDKPAESVEEPAEESPTGFESKTRNGNENLLASVLAQIKAQAIPDEESQPPLRDEDIPVESIEAKAEADEDLLGDVMAQIQAQTVSDEGKGRTAG